MQRYANLPVKTFIESHLRPIQTDETALNNLSCQYLWSKYFDSACIAAETAAKLMLTIYSWGHYPTRVIAFVCSWKQRTGFEESSSSPLLQSLTDMLVDLLVDNPHPSARRLYLKLLGLVRLNAMRDQTQLQKATWAALSSLGIHYQLDRLVLLFLIKCTLKISDKIKEYKYMIGKECARLIFAMFSSEYLQTAPVKEMAKLYMDFLKLLVALGREIAVCSSSDPKETTDDSYLSCFFKVMVCNLSLSVDEQYCLKWFDYSNMNLLNLLRDPQFVILRSFQARVGDAGTKQFQSMPLIYPDLEQHYDESSQGNMVDQELLEKIKTNSITLLMVLARVEPELLLASDVFQIVYPQCLQILDSSGVYESQHFFPVSIFNREVADVFRLVYTKPTMQIYFLQYLNMIEQRTEVARTFLTDFKRHLINILKSFAHSSNLTWSAQMSLLGFFMTETNYVVKSCLINAIGVIHNQVYTILEIRERTKSVPKTEQQNTVTASCETICKVATNFVTAYFCDLYTTEMSNMRHLLEGLHQCPVQSMLVHLPNKFVERVIHFLVIPVLAVCLHTHFDFCEQFDKFLATIFEARFSEFFLARINCLRELLVHNFGLSRTARQSCEQYGAKVKVLISAADELMEKFPHQMKQQYPLFAEFAISEILADKALTTVHYFAPLMLWRLSSMRREFLQEKINLNIYRSICPEDLKHRPASTLRLENLRLGDLEDLPNIADSKMCLREFVDSWDLVQKLYVRCLSVAKEIGFKDRYEKCLIWGLVMVNPSMVSIIQSNSWMFTPKYHLENLLIAFFFKIRSKKHQLMFLEHFLSSPFLEAPQLQKHLWETLFSMQKEKIFSVELTYTNYMVLQGLRNAPHMINPQQVVDIFLCTVWSLKSKNRKLVNNCLKIFGCILSSYSVGIRQSLLTMQVMNMMDESVGNENDGRPMITGLQFLKLALIKYLSHKYSKYNFLTLNWLSNIVNNIGIPNEPVSEILVTKLCIPLIPNVLAKWSSEDSQRYAPGIVNFLGKEFCLRALSEEQSTLVLVNCWKGVLGLPPRPESTFEEILVWREIQHKCLQLFLRLQFFHYHKYPQTIEGCFAQIIVDSLSPILGFMTKADNYLAKLQRFEPPFMNTSVFVHRHELHSVWILGTEEESVLLEVMISRLCAVAKESITPAIELEYLKRRVASIQQNIRRLRKSESMITAAPRSMATHDRF